MLSEYEGDSELQKEEFIDCVFLPWPAGTKRGQCRDNRDTFSGIGDYKRRLEIFLKETYIFMVPGIKLPVCSTTEPHMQDFRCQIMGRSS